MARRQPQQPQAINAPPDALFLQPATHHHDENLYSNLGGVIDPIPVPEIKPGPPDATFLITVNQLHNQLMNATTHANFVPNIKIGHVHQSIVEILPHHDDRVPANRRLRQSVAAVRAVKEYLRIAEFNIPSRILNDKRFCRGKGSANPKIHQRRFKNSMVAKLLWDAWWGSNGTADYKCINCFNHYPCHKDFFRPLAEWFVLNMNPHGDLTVDAILGTDPMEAYSSYKKKVRNYGIWDPAVIENFDDMETLVASPEHTKVICRGLPLPFALFIDRNYDRFWEECLVTSTHMMYVHPDKKTHTYWTANREGALFQRRSGITIPTLALAIAAPAPEIIREQSLAQQLITLRAELNQTEQSLNAVRNLRRFGKTKLAELRAENERLRNEQSRDAAVAAAHAERDKAVTELREETAEFLEEAKKGSARIRELKNQKKELRKQLTELRAENERLTKEQSKDAAVAAAPKERDTVITEMDKLKKEVTRLRDFKENTLNATRNARKIIEEANKKLESAVSERDSLKKELEEIRTTAHNAEVASAASVAALQQQLNATQESVAALQNQLNESQRNRQRLVQENSTLRQNVEDLTAQTDELRNEKRNVSQEESEETKIDSQEQINEG